MHAAGLAKSIGPNAPALVDLLADAPPGSQALLLQMLHVLTGRSYFWLQLTILFHTCSGPEAYPGPRQVTGFPHPVSAIQQANNFRQCPYAQANLRLWHL